MASIIIRTALIYLFLAAILRLMGKRQIGELQISELISTLLLSELAALPLEDPETPILYSVLPITLIVALELTISNLKGRFLVFKRLFEGRPAVLINKGEIDREEMRKVRITLEEMLSAFRLEGISDPSDVYYAIMEQNGHLSVIPKSLKQPLTPENMGIKATKKGIAHALIVDGVLSEKELKSCKKDKAWLARTLEKNKIK
ncbi:MAG: DUF421 domain-containing protein, partial [Clostridia bacterium]|nr:DUF421 domain-containing protein [Clostridia bacterium]